MEQQDEQKRLAALQSLELLDTAPSESFDRVTRMASRLFDLPIAAVSLTDSDRQWFKSRVGVDHQTLPRHKAPCAQVATSREFVVIPDLLADPCYAASPLAASGVRFYAGAPLVTDEGFGLGAMCVLGVEPRQVTPEEERSLTDMAAMIMSQIELQHAFGRKDPASGLPNRNQLEEDLLDMQLDASEPASERHLVLIDIAAPEQIGQLARAKGAAYVDQLIGETARLIQSLAGGGTRVYLVGLGQFALISNPGTEERRYLALLRSRLATLRETSSHRFVLTAAIGVAPFTVGEVKARDLVRRAANAAEAARPTDRRVEVYSLDLDAKATRRMRLVDDFADALLAEDQLRLAYQPRMDLKSGEVVGAEALLRWTHPEFGEVSPGEFIPLVEDTELVRTMTQWVIDKALDQAKTWFDQGLRLRLSLNVSASNLQEADFSSTVIEALRLRSLPPEVLEVELTESAFLADEGRAMQHMNALTQNGVVLAIDDFGTGYSGLSYLQTLPAKVVKIDQSFVRDVLGEERKLTLVRSMISLAHSLGYTVVAEGIETAEVSDMLRQAGCDEGQGYHLGRPGRPSDLERMCKPGVRHAA